MKLTYTMTYKVSVFKQHSELTHTHDIYMHQSVNGNIDLIRSNTFHT